MEPVENPWDEYAEAYAQIVARREQADPEHSPLADVPHGPGFPRFMVLSFDKP